MFLLTVLFQVNEKLSGCFPFLYPPNISIHIINAKKSLCVCVCVCVCVIKLHCHFLRGLAEILNKAMNSKGAASKLVPGADFIQLLILRHLFLSVTPNFYSITK